MLNRALKCRRALTHLYNTLLSPSNPSIGRMESQDWQITHALKEVLKAFLGPTQHLSGCYYPTSNCVLPHLVDISDVLYNYTSDPKLAATVSAMTGKLRDYFVPFPPLFHVATMLDPRYKFRGTEALLKEFYKNIGVVDSESEATSLHTTTKNLLKELYRCRDQTNAPPPPALRSSSHSSWSFSKRSKQIAQDVGSSRAASTEIFSDMLVYEVQQIDEEDLQHQGGNEGDDFNVLSWWKKRTHMMPVLSMLARDVLASPASTVSSESAFSSGGRVLEPHRHRLKETTVEACVCLKDWSDAISRKQTDPHFWWPEDSDSGSGESLSPPDLQQQAQNEQWGDAE